MSDRPLPTRPQSGAAATIPRGQGRAAITDAAREIFAERGYHGASIRDIAKRAGLSLSALYYWHASKQDLLAALLSESRHDYLQACTEAVRAAPVDDPAARLCALVGATVEYRVRRRTESDIAAREWRNLEQPHVAQLDQLSESASRLWTEIIEAGVRAGVFACDHPEDARRAVQAACNAIPQWYDPNGPVGVDELVDRYVAIALRVVDHQP